MKFLPKRSRKNTVLTHVIQKDKISHFVMDKLAIVIFQEFVWFAIVELAESCLLLAGSDPEWCFYNSIDLFSPNITALVASQMVMDSFF